MIALSPAGSTPIAAQPVLASASSTRLRSTPAARDRVSALAAECRARPPRHDDGGAVTGRRDRLVGAFAAWLDPDGRPRTVSPDAGMRGYREDQIEINGSENDDHEAVYQSNPRPATTAGAIVIANAVDGKVAERPSSRQFTRQEFSHGPGGKSRCSQP